MASTETPPPVVLLQMMTGYWVSKALNVAAELGLADLLTDGPRASDDLAAQCEVDPASLYRLMRALASTGVFTEVGDRRFALSPLAELLRSDTPHSMRALARMYGSEQYQAWADLSESIRTGEPSFDRRFDATYFDYLGGNPQASSIFNEAMTGWTTQVADAVTQAYDFAGAEHIVDVGGGHGLLLAAILGASPSSRGTLFELPHVVDGAERVLKTAGVLDRCNLVGGDFFESVPEGADVYVLAQILHDWDDNRSRLILENCKKAMRRRGKILIVEQVLPPGDEPSLGKWLDLHMLVLLTGQERTEAEYGRLLDTAGLRLSRVVPTASGASIVEAVL